MDYLQEMFIDEVKGAMNKGRGIAGHDMVIHTYIGGTDLEAMGDIVDGSYQAVKAKLDAGIQPSILVYEDISYDSGTLVFDGRVYANPQSISYSNDKPTSLILYINTSYPSWTRRITVNADDTITVSEF